MDIYLEVEKLMEYSVKNGFVDEEDKILITNFVLECIELDTYRCFSDEEKEIIKKEIEKLEYPSKLLNNIVNWASENGKIKNNTATFHDLLNSKIMGYCY